MLYGCKAWSLTIWEERRLRILRRIFGPKGYANAEGRTLHNKELHGSYHSPNTIRVIKFRRLRWADHVARTEEGRSSFKILTGTPTGKKRLGKA